MRRAGTAAGCCLLCWCSGGSSSCCFAPAAALLPTAVVLLLFWAVVPLAEVRATLAEVVVCGPWVLLLLPSVLSWAATTRSARNDGWVAMDLSELDRGMLAADCCAACD